MNDPLNHPSPSALEIISALTEGFSPLTGEVLPANILFNEPGILRALFAAKAALERCEELDRRRRTLPAKAGAPWSPDEETILVNKFDQGGKVYELARELGRTAGAIEARLIKLGKIQDNGQVRFLANT